MKKVDSFLGLQLVCLSTKAGYVAAFQLYCLGLSQDSHIPQTCSGVPVDLHRCPFVLLKTNSGPYSFDAVLNLEEFYDNSK